MKNFKINTKIIVTNLADSVGKIVTSPVKVLNEIYYGIEFENPMYNEIFNPRYINEKLILEVEN